jgi:uncharacterized protein YbaA (DUF1428 family)
MSKGTYVEGFVIPVPKAKVAAYKKIARKACKIWLEYGALEYREAVGDDLGVPFGLPFPKLTQLKPSETIIFAWIVYRTKAQRNRINKLIMKDPRLSEMSTGKMPFDVSRMSVGGFRIIVKE